MINCRRRLTYWYNYMPNGKPGDHPYTDIIVHGTDLYSQTVAQLVREISGLADEKTRRDLSDLLITEYNEYSNPDVDELERVLTELRDKLLKQARDRGYEV